MEPLALLAEGHRISALSRVKGHKKDTILQWLREAAQHIEPIESVQHHDQVIGFGRALSLAVASCDNFH